MTPLQQCQTGLHHAMNEALKAHDAGLISAEMLAEVIDHTKRALAVAVLAELNDEVTT